MTFEVGLTLLHERHGTLHRVLGPGDLDDVVGSFRLFDETGDPSYLDERSVPFGVASLAFSRTVTDTARVWLQSWRQAHGDLTGLPYPLDDPSDGETGMATKGSS